MTAAVSPAEQARGLRDAAQLVAACGQMAAPLHGPDDRPIAALHPKVAYPLAAILLVAATAVEQECGARGLSVANALELAGAVLGADLGHRDAGWAP